MTRFVDTHCHLDLDRFDDDRAAVLQRARDAGVAAMLLIGYNPERWAATSEMCERWPFLRRSVGVHPNDAEIWSGTMRDRLCKEVETSGPVAIGEIGLDFFRSRDTEHQQRAAFKDQLGVAREFGLPVVIHQRSAEDDVLEVLSNNGPLTGVMHCFGGDPEYAERCLDLGFYLGVGGSISYPRSHSLREAVAGMPLDRLLLETDSPFLAPQSRRGKRNEPAYLIEIMDEIARVRETTVDEIAEHTTANAVRLFGESIRVAVESG